MRPPEHPLALALLALPAALYGVAVRSRNRRFDRAGAAVRADLPVISIGNLTVGGTGKTPVVAWATGVLLARGLRPAIVSRGYGGSAGRGPLVVSGADGPTCPAKVCGDEPFWLASVHSDAIVVVGSDRVAGARRARELGANVAILDDGFQHRRLARDLDVVLLDASNPFGNHRLLPAGLLREPVSGLRRADLVLVTRTRPDEGIGLIERVVRLYNRDAPILQAGHRREGFVNAAGAPATAPDRAVAFCGIGNPASFRIDLEQEGVTLAHFEARRDHHVFSTEDLARLAALAAERRARLVTTEKDLARMGELAAGREDLFALRIAAEIFEPAPLLAAIERVTG